MNKQLIVPRDSHDEATFVVIDYAGCEQGQLLARLREAMQLWKKCVVGLEAMEDTSGDFNVGDPADYTPAGEGCLHDDLSACLAQVGISYLNIDVYSQDGAAPGWDFDTLLG